MNAESGISNPLVEAWNRMEYILKELNEDHLTTQPDQPVEKLKPFLLPKRTTTSPDQYGKVFLPGNKTSHGSLAKLRQKALRRVPSPMPQRAIRPGTAAPLRANSPVPQNPPGHYLVKSYLTRPSGRPISAVTRGPSNTISRMHVLSQTSLIGTSAKMLNGSRSIMESVTEAPTLVMNTTNVQEPPLLIHSVPLETILELYRAKCMDFNIEVQESQAQRFAAKFQKICRHRVLMLKEQQLGFESAKILYKIIKENHHFTRLELPRNCLGDKGAALLSEALVNNTTVVHLNVTSNNFSPAGCDILLSALLFNKTLASFNISSSEGINRNRVAAKGGFGYILENIARENHVLQILNLSGTSLTLDVIERFCHGLEAAGAQSGLASVNLANNDLGSQGVSLLAKVLPKTNIAEIILSNNKILDQGGYAFSQIFKVTAGHISEPERIDLAGNSLTCSTLIKLCDLLSKNLHVKHLNLSNNRFGGRAIGCLIAFFGENTALTSLVLNNCELETHAGEALGYGIGRNLTIEHLSLSHNMLRDEGVKGLSQGLIDQPSLKYLDLSFNNIKNQGGLSLATVLKKNRNLTTLLLNDNNFTNEAAEAFCDALRVNQTLRKLNLELNAIAFRYISEVAELTNGNINRYKRNMLPNNRAEKETLIAFQAQKVNVEEELQYAIYKERDLRKEHQDFISLIQKGKEEEMKLSEDIERLVDTLHDELVRLDKERIGIDAEMGEAKFFFEEEKRRLEGEMKEHHEKTEHFESEERRLTEEIIIRAAVIEKRKEMLKREENTLKNRFTLSETAYKNFQARVEAFRARIEEKRQEETKLDATLMSLASKQEVSVLKRNRSIGGAEKNERRFRTTSLENPVEEEGKEEMAKPKKKSSSVKRKKKKGATDKQNKGLYGLSASTNKKTLKVGKPAG